MPRNSHKYTVKISDAKVVILKSNIRDLFERSADKQDFTGSSYKFYTDRELARIKKFIRLLIEGASPIRSLHEYLDKISSGMCDREFESNNDHYGVLNDIIYDIDLNHNKGIDVAVAAYREFAKEAKKAK